MKTKFLVSIPKYWLDGKDKNPINLHDVDKFYINLLAALKDMDYDVKTTTTIKELIETDGIFLSHHTNFANKNIWNIKKGYLQGYLYFDRTGFSGWAEIANSEQLFNESQNLDLEKATEFFTNFSNDYKQQRSSKMPQTGTFSTKEPYIFVAGQNPADTVSELARIPTRDLMKHVAEAFKNTKYKVVIKIHPLEQGKGQEWVDKEYKFLKHYPNVIITSASIHDIIPNAAGVYTVNSGVGFESLLYLKHVFVSGHCDYHWVATNLHEVSDIQNTAHVLEKQVDKEMIIKFIYYMLTEYFVNSGDMASIRQKIERTVREYNEI